MAIKNEFISGPNVPSRSKKSKISLLWTQFGVLMQKNFLLGVRNWKSSMGQILAPLLIVFLLLGFQQVANYVLTRDDPHPNSYHLGNISKCWDRNTFNANNKYGTQCKTVVYAPKGVPWIEELMQRVAIDNGLDFEKDFLGMGKGGSYFNIIADNSTLYNYILNNPNKTQNAVFFQSAYVVPGSNPQTKIPSQPGYILFYNTTEASDHYWQNPAVELARSMDRAILNMQGEFAKNISYNVDYRPFPRAKSRIAEYDVVASDGGVWFYVPPMVIFFILLTEIVNEKEQRLRLGMRMMGMKDSMYWLTWFINGFIFQILSSLVLITSASAAQFKFFTNSDFFALMFLFVLFGLAIQSVGFFLSTLISKSKTAQTVGYAAVLIGFVFQAILNAGYGLLVDLLYSDDIKPWIKFVRWGFTVYPPYNFAKCYSDIAKLSANEINFANGNIKMGQGFKWGDLFKTTPLDANFMKLGIITIPAPIQSIYLLLGDIALFLILTWYFDNVLPGEHGSPRPFYFFLTPSYWGFSKQENRRVSHYSSFAEDDEYVGLIQGEDGLGQSGYDSDVEEERKRTKTMDPNRAAVKVLGLSKVYQKGLWKSSGDFKAVDNVSFSVEKGEIFCLLGHNGAGKTTTMNMLTGLFPSTEGNATINGFDVRTDMDDIRNSLGVTPQHDILWGELTAIEHLQLFAKLKGFYGIAAEEEISKRLNKMGLWDVRNHRVRTFSGGMKRRLSVAIATIGGPSVIFMDEPSTGMDPVNRRHMWELIADLKKESSIILTTHSMEEAQNLADRITIMAHGKMRCLGNTLHLKNKFGKGYRLEVMTDKDKVRGIERDLRNICPDIRLNRNDAGNLLFDIPASSPDSISSLVTYLEDKSPKEGSEHAIVREFGISHSTLEEVFLEVTRRNNFAYEDEEEEFKEDDNHNHLHVEEEAWGKPSDTSLKSVTSSLERTKSISDVRDSRPLRALMRKNLSLQKRQIGTNICQILTPILVMCILLVLQSVIKSEVGDSLSASKNISTLPYFINSLGLENSDFPMQPSCYQNLWFVDEESTGKPSVMLKNLTRIGCLLRNGTRRNIPVFQGRDSLSQIDSEMYKHQSLLNTLSTKDVQNPPLNYLLPDGFYQFHKVDWGRNSTEMSYTFSVNDLPVKSYHRSDGFTRFYVYKLVDSLVIIEGKVAAMSLVFDGFSRRILEEKNKKEIRGDFMENFSLESSVEDYIESSPYAVQGVLNEFASNFTTSSIREDVMKHPAADFFENMKFFGEQPEGSNKRQIPTPAQIKAKQRMRALQIMPYQTYINILSMLELAGTLLYPIALTIQLPIYLYLLVMEKGGTKELMKSHGMKSSSYILSHYLFNFILFSIVAASFWLFGLAIGLRLFSETHPVLLFFLFLGWANAMIAMAFFLSTFIDTTRTATVVGYVFALMGSLIGILFCAGIYGFGLPYSIPTPLPIPYLFFPQFAFIRIITLMNYRCTQKFLCYGMFHSFGEVFESELGRCIVFLFVDAVIYMVVALYLEAVWPRAYGVPKHPLFFLGFGKKKEVKYDSEDFSSNEDEDVRAERERVSAINDEEKKEYPLLIQKLRKVFPSPAKNKPPKIAVRGLYLGVPRGECFGLLGENGAGKTTTISIVTGLITPSSGTAFVVGHDIRSEIDQVHLNIGICPQFSVLWGDLSVEEHLLFYARLKGIKSSHEKSHVEECLRQYGLLVQRNKKAKDLSGGMQRRLSVAIALVGDSQIVFLDEPTTGLDPASKRQLWRIISSAKSGRAIILTTHSMEEAELLCSRIGIVALGEMRCLGSPLRLKNKFANGYCLEINFNPEDQEFVEESMRNAFGDSIFEAASFRGTKEYRLSQDNFKLSELFGKMEKESKGMKIKAWSLSQSGLEDVFQKIVEDSHKK